MIVKLNRREAKISYLAYPCFDADPHPALQNSVLADLAQLRVRFHDFSNSGNPPILHRKETFVPEDYPGRPKFARLTAQEERRGLLADASGIGTREAWNRLMTTHGLCCRGHNLVRGNASA